jgi:hypothetical protein
MLPQAINILMSMLSIQEAKNIKDFPMENIIELQTHTMYVVEKQKHTIYFSKDECKVYNYLQEHGSASVDELKLAGVKNPGGVVYWLRMKGIAILSKYQKATVTHKGSIIYGHSRYYLR